MYVVPSLSNDEAGIAALLRHKEYEETLKVLAKAMAGTCWDCIW
jgi:hypothetical protein